MTASHKTRDEGEKQHMGTVLANAGGGCAGFVEFEIFFFLMRWQIYMRCNHNSSRQSIKWLKIFHFTIEIKVLEKVLRHKRMLQQSACLSIYLGTHIHKNI